MEINNPIGINNAFERRRLSDLDSAHQFVDNNLVRIINRALTSVDDYKDILLDLKSVLDCGVSSEICSKIRNPIKELSRKYLCDNKYCAETVNILLPSLLRMMLQNPNLLTGGITLHSESDDGTVPGTVSLDNPLYMLIYSPWQQLTVHRLDTRVHLRNYSHHIFPLFMLMILTHKSALGMRDISTVENLHGGIVNNNIVLNTNPLDMLSSFAQRALNSGNDILYDIYLGLLVCHFVIDSEDLHSIQSIKRLMDCIISIRSGHQKYDHAQLEEIVSEIKRNIESAEGGRNFLEKLVAETGRLLINNIDFIKQDIHSSKLRCHGERLSLSLGRRVILNDYSTMYRNGKKGRVFPPELINEMLQNLPRRNLNHKGSVDICKYKMVLSVVLAEELGFIQPPELLNDAISKLESCKKNYRSTITPRLIRETNDKYNCVIHNINYLLTVRDYTFTLLHLAVENGDLDKVKILMAEGADVHIKDSDGYTPLDYAVRSDAKEIKAILSDKISKLHENTALKYVVAAVVAVAIPLLFMYFTQLSTLTIALYTASFVLVSDIIVDKVATKLNELNCNNVVESMAHSELA